jgi:hypothetical protein
MKSTNPNITSSQILSDVAKAIFLRASDPRLPLLPAGSVYAAVATPNAPKFFATKAADVRRYLAAHIGEHVGIFARMDWKWSMLIVLDQRGVATEGYRFSAGAEVIERIDATASPWSTNPSPTPAPTPTTPEEIQL